jgi:hypothetical protein
MKRWLLICIPLAILTVLLFVKPPAFSAHKSAGTPTGITNTNAGTTGGIGGVKPGISGGGDDGEGGLVNGEKPAYGGHEADNYDPN